MLPNATEKLISLALTTCTVQHCATLRRAHDRRSPASSHVPPALLGEGTDWRRVSAACQHEQAPNPDIPEMVSGYAWHALR